MVLVVCCVLLVVCLCVCVCVFGCSVVVLLFCCVVVLLCCCCVVALCVVGVVVEMANNSKRIIIVRGADLSDFPLIFVAKMCGFVSHPMKIVTFPLKNRGTPKWVVDFLREKSHLREVRVQWCACNTNKTTQDVTQSIRG